MSRRGSILQDYGGHLNPMPTDAQEASANYYQRSKEFNAQMQQRQEEKADANKYRNLNMIDVATDPSKYQSSTQKANALATEQLLGIRNEFASKSNMPADQLYMELQQKLTPVAQGYNSYKNDLSEQEEMAKEAVKVNPNLNLEKVLAGLQQQADKHHLITNPDGSVNFNQATIGTSSNALTEILKPENAWKYSKGIKPVVDYVKTQGKDAELFAKSSDGSQINYKAKIPDWATLVDQRGKPISVDPNTGLIPRGAQPILALKGTKQDYQDVDENGKPVIKTMTVVSQDTMNKILANDELQYAFEGDWQKHKQLAKIDVDPAHERDLKKVYFSQWLADNGLNQPYVASRTHLPPQPRISVKVGGDKQDNGAIIRDVYKEIDEQSSKAKSGYGIPLNSLSTTAQGIVIEYANKLTGGNLTQADIYVRKEPDGKISIMSADNELIAPMDFTDVNIKAQPGVKEKREVIEQGKKQQTTAPETSKWDKYKRQ